MRYKNIILVILFAGWFSLSAFGQESKSSGIRRADNMNGVANPNQVSSRVQAINSSQEIDDSQLAWMKVVYRQLDLTQAPNAALYFPEDDIDGETNLFRLMLGLLTSGKVPAYEYRDGKEVYNDANRLKVKDMLDRFRIYYTEGKGSTEKNPVFEIDGADVPSDEVLSLYIIERWELDRCDTRLHRRIEAICPVLHRSEEFGYEAVRYPMFWMRYDDLRPYLASRLIFTDDDNNVPTCTYDDYFTLGLYDGEIYKTRNLRNKSMVELYPDPEERKLAQDSIERRLANLEKDIWVEDPVEKTKETVDGSASETIEKSSKNTSVKSTQKKANRLVKTTRGSSSATRSVRSRKE